MSPTAVGQRCVSEREPEQGLGVVQAIDRTRVTVRFPATGEQRTYAAGTAVLKRVRFRAGEQIADRQGRALTVEVVEEHGDLIVYRGEGRSLREDEISDLTNVSSPPDRLLAGQVDESAVFSLRLRALQMQAALRQSPVRGYVGGRVELIPHQFYILHDVASRQLPRVLLADEVGLGKTIEACLILQRLLTVGKAQRALVLVPESLVHQWFVELLRRFNLWFTIFDEERCALAERADPMTNPFLSSQLGLASVSFGATETRREQIMGAGWDLLIVDEAHHLKWTPESASPEYQLVDALAAKTPGVLLLTATPTQLGLAGHFARLRLLDPYRFNNYERFVAEAESYAAVAEWIGKLLSGQPLTAEEEAHLRDRFKLEGAAPSATRKTAAQGKRHPWVQRLLDQHGVGRIVFRNTRAAITGFPGRKLNAVTLLTQDPALLARAARELEAEEVGSETQVRYSFKDDPRIQWLADFLREDRLRKVLLICKTQRKVLAIDTALKEKLNAKLALFHEGLPLVQRDRNAAYFAEPDGAQLLICSEIGSEGRNFQFAHDLVLFDLPLNPGVLEQRIGRLDRIGQKTTVQIHALCLAGSADAFVVDWYHRGLNAFEAPLQSGAEFEEAFKARLLRLATELGEANEAKLRKGETLSAETASAGGAEWASFVAETIAFREALAERLARGRDRLLELHSFDPEVASRVLGRVREADSDASLRQFVFTLLDHFGVRIKEHEGDELFLDPAHAYVESFPSIPAEGMLATFNRARALAREDIRFVSADHPLVRDAIDLLLNSPAGTTAFCSLPADTPNILLEAVFVAEPIAERRWSVDQFFAPTPIRVVVDVAGQDLTVERDAAYLASECDDADIHRFLDTPGFNRTVLDDLLSRATELANERVERLRATATKTAETALRAEIQRLRELQQLNDLVRPEEIALFETQLEQTRQAIARVRPRLDSIRLILEAER